MAAKFDFVANDYSWNAKRISVSKPTLRPNSAWRVRCPLRVRAGSPGGKVGPAYPRKQIRMTAGLQNSLHETNPKHVLGSPSHRVADVAYQAVDQFLILGLAHDPDQRLGT